ncbi:MAG: RdgB/HAM1 family non-canonical purine NTP pyrophosphatase [Pseudomonadota bacterium]
MRELVLASGNPRKLREFRALLSDPDIQVLSQSELGVASPEETGLTFVENALIKARHAAHHTGKPAVADDSGIAVDVLGGRPGIFSARYAGVGASDEENLSQLLADVRQFSDKQLSCRFVCVLAYLGAADDPLPLICTATWEGRLIRAPRGENGFGYDPIFFLDDHGCTSAELASEVKNEISHRGQAFRMFHQQFRRFPS